MPDDEVVLRIEILREPDGRYFVGWDSGAGHVAGGAGPSPTIVGALADLCASLIKLASEDEPFLNDLV